MKKKVLYVDDEQDQISSLKFSLEAITDEYELIGVGNGFECVEYLKKERPDMILIDMMMPGLNGWQVFDIIQKNDEWKTIPVAFLTGVSDPVTKTSGQLVADDYIEKPVDAETLKQRLDKILKTD